MRRVPQLEREKQAVLAQAQLLGVMLDPDESYTRLQVGA